MQHLHVFVSLCMYKSISTVYVLILFGTRCWLFLKKTVTVSKSLCLCLTYLQTKSESGHVFFFLDQSRQHGSLRSVSLMESTDSKKHTHTKTQFYKQTNLSPQHSLTTVRESVSTTKHQIMCFAAYATGHPQAANI